MTVERHVRRIVGSSRPNGSPNATLVEEAQQCAEADEQARHQWDCQPRIARHRRRDDQELTHEDAHRRHACDREYTDHESPSEQRMRLRQSADLGDLLRALDLRDVTDRVEDRRLGQAVHRHVQQPGEVRQRSTDAERERDDAHVFDRRVREQAFDVAASYSMNAPNVSDARPMPIISGPGATAPSLPAISILKRSTAYSATFSSSPDNTAEIGVGPSACASGSQPCTGTSPTFVPYPSSRNTNARFRIAGSKLRDVHDQIRPRHRRQTFAEHRQRGDIDERRAEQRERDADAAENEVLPRRLQRFVGAIQSDHHDRRQRREFDRDPHQSDVVRDEREVHAEHHRLEHRVVETDVVLRQPAGVDLVIRCNSR